MSPQPVSTTQGLRGHVPAPLPEAGHAAVPRVQAPGLPALPRPPPPAPPPERAREVHRLLALRRGLPGRLHPRRRGREHARQPRLARRALRAHLRDQPGALHLLRLLRARVPVRRDHARQRLRALRVLARRPDLHEGHAARGAAQDGAGRGSDDSTTRRSPTTRRTRRWTSGTSSSGSVWFAAAFACLGSGIAVVWFSNPFYSALALIGNLAALAVLYLLLQRRVRRRCAGARLRGRRDGDVPVRDRLPRRPRRRTVGRRADVAAGRRGQRGGGDPRRGRRRRRPRRRAQLSNEPPVDAFFGCPHQIGELFLTDHLLAFEIISIVLLSPRSAASSSARTPRRLERADGGRRPGRHLVPRRLGAPLHDRRARRADPPQPADHPALARDHAQRGRTSR